VSRRTLRDNGTAYVSQWLKAKRDLIEPTYRALNTRQAPRFFRATAMAVIAVLMSSPARAAAPPTLLVLPLDMIDNSGEAQPHAGEHEDRLKALTSYLSKALAEEQIYTIIDTTPIDTTIAAAHSAQALSECNGCERDLAKLLHADRVLVGQIDKISTLIGNLTVRITDVEAGRIAFARTVSFRGDTDDAWQHATRFLIRDLRKSAR
jgi:hypothetical protein